jgi:hypothetical protein
MDRLPVLLMDTLKELLLLLPAVLLEAAVAGIPSQAAVDCWSVAAAMWLLCHAGSIPSGGEM